VAAIVSKTRRRAQAHEARIYCPSALVANPDGTVDYDDLPFAVNCLLEEITYAFEQITGSPPERKPKIALTVSIEF
jgi:hypothetical protein